MRIILSMKSKQNFVHFKILFSSAAFINYPLKMATVYIFVIVVHMVAVLFEVISIYSTRSCTLLGYVYGLLSL